MNVTEVFSLAQKFQSEGKIDLALQTYQECGSIDPFFAPAHANLYQIFRQRNDLVNAREELIRFLNCPITGFTIDSIPKAKQELAELEKQIASIPK